MSTASCVVCGQPSEYIEGFKNDTDRFQCPRCGDFYCTAEAKAALGTLATPDRFRLSGVMRETSEKTPKNQRLDHCLIRSDNIEILLSNAPQRFDVATKVRKLLAGMARNSVHAGHAVALKWLEDMSLAYAENEEEFKYLAYYARSKNWLQGDSDHRGISGQLTPDGWEEVRQRPWLESPQGFVAMAFAEVMKATYAFAIYPAVRDDCGFDCKRIDAKEYNGAIMDEIMAEIRQSRFVIADVTLQSNGVYYEAGFADGLGVPVVWTCDEQDKDNVHFDAKHLNLILWKSHDDLRERLKNRILATIGRGPLALPTADKPNTKSRKP